MSVIIDNFWAVLLWFTLTIVVSVPASLGVVRLTETVPARIRARLTSPPASRSSHLDWFAPRIAPDTPPIPAHVRAELDQSPEWWDQQYQALVREVFPPKPFDITEHEGHEIVADYRIGRVEPTYYCTRCPTDA